VAGSRGEHLTEEGLAARSGTTRDLLRRLIEVGILAPSRTDGTFLSSDLPKVSKTGLGARPYTFRINLGRWAP
jgi:hypothetical protein